MGVLSKDAIHPSNIRSFAGLIDVVDKKAGLLAEFPILSVYLAAQLELLALRDTMFAHDCSSDPRVLLRYAKGEMVETAELIPIYSGLTRQSTKDPSRKVNRRVGKKASIEGGDVWWFLAMGEGLRQLYPADYKLTKEAIKDKALLLASLSLLATRYQGFRPENFVNEVVEKNNRNWPDRPLRSASLDTSQSEMAHDFETNRYPLFKLLRDGLHERKIPPALHQALQSADDTMPKLSKVHKVDPLIYKRVVALAQQASSSYAY